MIRTRVGGIRTGDSDFIEKKCKQAIDNFMADAFDIVKEKTPFDTGRARRGWRKKNKGRKLENRVPYIVRLNEGLVNRLMDADGKRIFNEHNKQELMKNADPKVLLQIVSQINDDDEPVSVEKATKNSK